MHLLALDLATVSGYAFGETGDKNGPQSGSYRLKEPKDPIEVAPAELSRWIRQYVRDHGKPDLIIAEKWMPSVASRSGAATEFQCLLHGALHGLGGVYGFSIVSPTVFTVRKFFVGQSRVPGGPEEAKRAVLNRCILLRYLPRDCVDFDRADSCALWAWGEATFGKVRPYELVLFGEET